MQLGDHLGFAGVVLAVAGIGIAILWPAKRWIGVVCLVVAVLLGFCWGGMAYLSWRHPSVESSIPKRVLPSNTQQQAPSEPQATSGKQSQNGSTTSPNLERQDLKRLEQEREDVYEKLHFLLPRTKGLDAINTAFKVINDSDHEILAEPLLCGQSDSVIRFPQIVINGGSSYADKRTIRVEKGGDVQSTTCLHPITLAIGMPDYSLLCADIRVHLNYYLAEDPHSMQTKIRRFLGVPAENGFNWEELPVNAPESPCRAQSASGLPN